MAKPSLEEAINNVEVTYNELSEIANDMIGEVIKPVNDLLNELNDKIDILSLDEIRGYILRFAMRSASISEIRDRAMLKAECAQAIRKEAYARKYAQAEGTQSAKDGYALLNISEQTVTEALYELISNLLKTKADSCNRTVDALKSILISKQQEMKNENQAIM